MCTLIWKPTSEGVLIGSNRDEWPGRGNASIPAWNTMNGKDVFAPIDPAKGGSWFACIPHKRLCVILNGGYIKHKHQPPYKMSRGIVLINALTWPIQQTLEYDFSGIEPFTLVIRDFETKSAYTLVWDGSNIDIQTEHWSSFRVWSSATLYDQAAHDWGVETTKDLIKESNKETIYNALLEQEFHNKRTHCAYEDSPPIETMASIVLEANDSWEFLYSDHINNEKFRYSFLS